MATWHRFVLFGVLAQACSGSPGAAGLPCSVSTGADGVASIRCPDGSEVKLPGGKDGASCSVMDHGNGTKTVACSDGTSVTVTDGTDGPAGPVGSPPTSGSDLRVTSFHGTPYLESTGEFAPCVPGGPLYCGKFFAHAKITEATADAAGTTTVKFKVFRDTAEKVPVTGLKLPVPTGGTSVSFNIAKLVPAAANESYASWIPYLNSVQTVCDTATPGCKGPFPMPAGTKRNIASTENGGTLTDHQDGTYVYVFKTGLATATWTRDDGTTEVVGYERNRLHRVCVMLGGHAGATATDCKDFVPDGSTATEARDIVQTSACRSCHGEHEFHGHGGNRLIVENCVTCHNARTTDPNSGNTMDFKQLVHKIHAGGHLASIPGADGIVWDNPETVVNEAADNGMYAVWGFGDTKHEWWKVGFPAEISNCTKCHNGSGAQVDNWKKVPSRAACGSCHDNISWSATNTATTCSNVTLAAAGRCLPHPPGPVSNDAVCGTCHPAEELPAPALPSIGGAVTKVHDFFNRDPRNVPEYVAELSVNTPARGYFVAGESPVVTLRLRDNEQPSRPYLADHRIQADYAITATPRGDGPEGCEQTGCPPRDGKFTVASLFVHGPRARRVPVLSFKARVSLLSKTAGPAWNLSAPVTAGGLTSETSSLVVKFDNGRDVWSTDGGATQLRAGVVTVPLVTVKASSILTSGADCTASGCVLTDANFRDPAWKDHQWAGYTFQITSGTGKDKTAQILDNTATTLTLAAGLTVTPDATSAYRIVSVTGSVAGGVTAVQGKDVSDSLNGANWRDDQLKGFWFVVVSGGGQGEAPVQVTGNRPGVLTLASLPAGVDTTTTFVVTPIRDVGSASAGEVATWLNAFPAFSARGSAWVCSSAQYSPEFCSLSAGDVGKISIRSRALGELFALQFLKSTVSSVVFGNCQKAGAACTGADLLAAANYTDGAVKVIGGSTVGNTISMQTDPSKNDPFAKWELDKITYTLDPVDDLKPGTYLVGVEMADRGNFSEANYKTPTVARVAFQVKTGSPEPLIADSCGKCHTDPTDTMGLVVDPRRHNKLLNNTAPDLCGQCHDYQSGASTGDWSGARPISRRVHGIHYGSGLKYPLQTVWYGNGDPVKGRNWDITLPQEVRNCDTTCHGPTTSGTWKTNPNLVACWGCHDSDESTAHMKAMSFDPTSADPYSGDEVSTCKACHAAP